MGAGPHSPTPFLFRGVRRYYRTNLRARRPPPTSSAPAPSAIRPGVLIPPDGGSAFSAGAGAGAGAAGAGAGAAGAAGTAFGGGGAGAGAALGGSGSHPALASLALASATTAGSSWARAGEAANRATASIAASIINFLNLTYLLLLESLFSCQRRILLKGSASKRAVTLLLRYRFG